MAVEPKQELTLAALRSALNTEFTKHEADFLVLTIRGNVTKEPELIINPRANFEEKINYLMEAYNEDLTMRKNPSIHITDYQFLSREQLKDYF